MKGSFRKRGSSWEFRVDIGRDPFTNKRIQKSASGFKTKREAQAACAELITQVEKGTYINEKEILVTDFFKQWNETYIQRHLRKRTADVYQRVINNTIIPYLGSKKIKNVTISDAQNLFYVLQEKGLSSSYLSNVYAVLKSGFKKAVDWEIISKNVFEKVDKPKVVKKDKVTWTIEECNTFLEEAKKRHPSYYICFLLAIFTGMRKSEILGLRWKNIDFRNKLIKVTHSLYDAPGGEYIFDELKSSSAYRTITVDDDLLKDLIRHKARQNENRLLYGSEYSDLDLIIATHKGTPINQRTISTELYRNIDVLGLPKLRFHDLRHTHATILLQLGENPKVIQERLGHSNIGITLDIYSHVLPDMQKSTAEKISNAFRKTN